MGSCNFKTHKEIKSIKPMPPSILKKTSSLKRVDYSDEENQGNYESQSKNDNQIDENIEKNQEISGIALISSSEKRLDSKTIAPPSEKLLKIFEIKGKLSTQPQSPFQDKPFEIRSNSLDSQTLFKYGIWVSCKKGLKSDASNQDDFCIILSENEYILSVFDGHGVYGHEVSNFLASTLPNSLLENSEFQSDPLSSMNRAFLLSHQSLLKISASSHFDCNMSGSTGTILYKKNSSLYVSNVGDSTAILGRRVENKYTPIQLTIDHKPDQASEKLRIEANNGEIRKQPGMNPYKVYLKHKEYPGLSISRTLGNTIGQSIGITCLPSTKHLELTPDDDFVVIASKGVWEVVTHDEALEVVSHSNQDPKEATARITAMAWSKWLSNEKSFVEDLTVIISFLPKLNLSSE